MAVDMFVVAAICGNFQGESGVNPGAYENYDPLKPQPAGYGLGQWTDWYAANPPLMRRTHLWNWLSQNGYAQDSGDGQLAFLEYENWWTGYGAYGSQFTSLASFLSYIPAGYVTTEMELLVYAWNQAWEGIAISTARLQYALDIYAYLRDHINDPRNPWYARNNYLTLTEMYSNCLLVYDYFNNGPTPPPPPPVPVIPDEALYAILGKRKRGRDKAHDLARKRKTLLR